MLEHFVWLRMWIVCVRECSHNITYYCTNENNDPVESMAQAVLEP